MYKYINLDYLHEIADGDNEFIVDMIDSFLFQTPDFLENLAQAIVKKDWAEAEKIAHKIKPTVQYVGLHNITDKTIKLHENLRDGVELEKTAELFGEVNEYIKSSYKELKEVRDKLSAE